MIYIVYLHQTLYYIIYVKNKITPKKKQQKKYILLYDMIYD
jgi:hypothetical protein